MDTHMQDMDGVEAMRHYAADASRDEAIRSLAQRIADGDTPITKVVIDWTYKGMTLAVCT